MGRQSIREAALFAVLLCTVLNPARARGDDSSLAFLARSILGTDQGVYVEAADGTILLAQAADLPVHPASVSKVPTSLALLRKLGPDYRFVTMFSPGGPLRDGTLEGDLLVDGGGDPYFVDENALLVARRLNDVGVRRIGGKVRARGAFIFDWQTDDAGELLQQALSGKVSVSAWVSLQSIAPEIQTMPVLQFDVPDPKALSPAAENPVQPFLVHRSQPLLSLIKSLNDYSNNVFKPLADAAGGAIAVEALARESVPETMRSEITLGDGAGTDARNRLSPRAAVSLLRALERELALSGHALVDALPVAGIDAGTLHDRFSAPQERGRIVGKTGTFGDYGASALIGAIPTSDHGTVYFAILNHGVRVIEARARQDRFLRALLGRLDTLPWSYQADLRPAVSRAQVDVLSSQ